MSKIKIQDQAFTDIHGIARLLRLTLPHARRLWRAGKIPGQKLSHRVLRFHVPTVNAGLTKKGDKRSIQPTRDQLVHRSAQGASRRVL